MCSIPHTLRFTWPLLLAVFCLPCITAGATAVQSSSQEEPVNKAATCNVQIDAWVVSTRHLDCGCCCDKVDPAFEVLRCDPSGTWQTACIEDLLFDAPDLVTTVYVHGNRIEADEVEERLWQSYDGMSCGLPVRMRMIFWSWPSDKIQGQLRDVRHKLWRSNCEAYYLARFLQQQPHLGRWALVGYSLGSRIVTGSLHLLGGGCLECHQLPEQPGSDGGSRPRVILMAPAIATGSLLPGGQTELARAQAEEVLIIYNSLDPVLKRYWLVDKRARPRAVGYVGLPCCADGTAIEQYDVRTHVGRSHNEQRYFNSSFIMELLREKIIAAHQSL